MQWVSIDPAKGKTGYAIWREDRLIETGIIKKRGNKGQWYLNKEIMNSEFDSFDKLLLYSDFCICEVGFGNRPLVIAGQAERRGYIRSICNALMIDYLEINVSEWRRTIKEAYNVSFPKSSDRCKELSVKLVEEHYGIEVTNDEADAVLIGVAAMRQKLMEVWK